jgi:hypothetical protein
MKNNSNSPINFLTDDRFLLLKSINIKPFITQVCNQQIFGKSKQEPSFVYQTSSVRHKSL